ncbi:MAG: DNA pilot protein [Microvirus sp.]|nr:MAG: DNA pilot protein [Microvirus sp.]
MFSGLGDALGGMTGGLTAGFSTAMDIGGALYGNYASAKAATKAFDRDKWMMQNRYQMQVEDIRKSGLNPAMMYGGASPPAISAPMAPQRGPELGRAAQSASSAANVVTALADAQRIMAAKGLIEAQTKTEGERPALVKSEVNLNTLEKWNIDQKIKFLETEVAGQKLENTLKGMEVAQLKQLYPALLQMARQEVQAGKYKLSGERNQSAFEDSVIGRSIRYVQAVTGVGGDVVGAVAKGVGASSAYKIFKGTIEGVRRGRGYDPARVRYWSDR